MKAAWIICITSYLILAIMAVLAIVGVLQLLPIIPIKIILAVLVILIGFSFGYINRKTEDKFS